MTSAVPPSPPESSVTGENFPQNEEALNKEAISNETPTSAPLSSARESVPPDSSDVTSRAEAPVGQSVTRHKVLVNRVTYFGLFVALCAPIANFFLTYKEVDMGITFNIMMWTLFGIFWCLGFAALMGPIFAMVATVIRLLDIVPALGSSLWVLLSIRLTTAIINERKGLPGFLNNLPLFSLVFANGFAALTSLHQDFHDASTYRRSLANIPDANHRLSMTVGYAFRDGKCGLHGFATDTLNTKFNLPIISLPGTFLGAYQQVRDNSCKYLQGQDLGDFDSDFEIWQREARRLQRSLWLRRAFCIVGYLFETAALYFSFVFLNQLRAHTGKDDKNLPPDSLNILLPIWQIVLVAILSCLSDYLCTMLDVESTCTSPPEISSMMLRRLESHVNWCGPQSGYLTNGKWLRSPWLERSQGGIQAGELPTIGIVLDEGGVETGQTVLHSTVPNCRLIVKRVSPDLLRVHLSQEGDPERAALEGENVMISETDKVI